MERPLSVDALARALAQRPELDGLPHALLVDAARAGIRVDRMDPSEAAAAEAMQQRRRLLTPVVNATGVLLHTNLGRAPLGHALGAGIGVGHAGAEVGGTGGAGRVRASNIELDLATGRRGSRRTPADALLRRLTGAEASLVVNNCAAAVMLCLAAVAGRGDVIVSRGELVEIGGGFRIPDVLAQSGAQLVEVGTTNRTRLDDYRAALAAAGAPAMILKVHQSNYRITGFTEDVGVEALAGLGVPVVADIGSGLLDASTPWLADASGRTPRLTWLDGEPAARQTLAAGADLVVFSGDKLLGGPQAGILVGRRDLVERCARHPLARALRPGGTVLAALQDVLLAYAGNQARTIPFWDMALRSVEALEARATAVASQVDSALVAPVATEAVAGGGTLPGRTIASAGLAVRGHRAAALRHQRVPVIARVRDGMTFLDLRTVDPSDDGVVADALIAALAAPPSRSGAGEPEPSGLDDA